MEKKAAIGDIVANVDFVEDLTKDKGLKDKYIHLVALAQDKALKADLPSVPCPGPVSETVCIYRGCSL